MPDENQPEQVPDDHRFFVVGIGASAGGLEAIGDLIRNAPAEGMAYVVVQHLSPDHESMLTQLIGRASTMPVTTAADGTVIEPGHIYVIPPNADLAVANGALRLIAPQKANGLHLPIDYLFRSLATDQGPAAIGVVLSGTGSDGSAGLKELKAAGGFTFVQEPSTAKYDGMPRSALAVGAADFCLAPEAIAKELTRLATEPRASAVASDTEPSPESKDQLAKLFALIRADFGNDLTQYKHSTVDRRIERRMMLNKLSRLEDYVKLVNRNRAELRLLHKDILISVTRFFRDPEVFEVLRDRVFPQLIGHDRPIRVWVPACATGEEAYSLAISLLEFCEERSPHERIQIFGTDIEADSIEQARRGTYQAEITLDVSAARLHRYFVKRDDEYQISRSVRDLLVFSQQNLLRDAPFSHLDLVSCRNLLIYLQPAAQKKVLRIIHYALEPTGHLMLGTSETVGDAPELFSPLDRKQKLYTKKQVTPRALHEVSFGSRAPVEPARAPVAARPTLSLQAVADRKVLELLGPPGVVVSENLDILQFRGHTGTYLDPAPGAASFNLLKVARIGLHAALKNTLQQARIEQRRITSEIDDEQEGKRCLVQLDAIPLQDPETKARCFLVLFQRMPLPVGVAAVSTEKLQPGDPLPELVLRHQELERELSVTKEYLQSTVEEKDSTLEELQSANEELQSSNEELQSANEELETSKEEMQSTNEELTTVNEELHNRMGELSQANDDLHNVLAGVDNVVVIVGMDLRIRRYTVAAEKLFNLLPGDIGRQIGFLDSFLGAGAIEPRVSTVIQTLSTLDEEVLASNQRWYALKVSPYKTLDHAIRGALVNLLDVDVRKRALDVVRDVGAYAAKFLGAIGHPLLILDRKQRVVWANDTFLSTLQLSHEETFGSALTSLGARQFADPGLRDRLENVFASETNLRGHEMQLKSPEGGESAVRVGASLISVSTEVRLLLMSIEPTLGQGAR